MEPFAPFLQELFNNLSEIIIFLAIAIITASLGHIKRWWQDRAIKRFERGINQNVRLRELLSELRVPYQADRVCLYQFYNGDYYLAGGSIMKTFLTHFVTKVGVSNPAAGEMIPSTQMVMSLKALQDKPSVILLADTFADDNFLESLFVETGNQKVLATAVRDIRRNWIGILCVAWLTDPGKRSDDILLSYAKQIGDFLSHHN